MAGVDDKRRNNHPWQNLPEMRLCNKCGAPLHYPGAEYTIGVHIWCVHEQRKLEKKRIPSPGYGTTPPEIE